MSERPLEEVGALAAARRRELNMDRAALARTAGVDPKTLRAFEEGERWPRDQSRTRIESALKWPAGILEKLRRGEKFPVRVDVEYLRRPRPPRDLEAELAQVPVMRLPELTPTDLLILARDTPPEDRTEQQWDLLHEAEERLNRLERRIAVAEELLLQRTTHPKGDTHAHQSTTGTDPSTQSDASSAETSGEGEEDSGGNEGEEDGLGARTGEPTADPSKARTRDTAEAIHDRFRSAARARSGERGEDPPSLGK